MSGKGVVGNLLGYKALYEAKLLLGDLISHPFLWCSLKTLIHVRACIFGSGVLIDVLCSARGL